ncbi:vacuolar protein sorting 11 isoform X2 [Wolffia australiana]
MVEDASDKAPCPITALGFRVEGNLPQLFSVTPFSVSLFDIQGQPPKRQTLDHIGCELNSVAMNDRQDLIIGRPEAVYFYDTDGRGPCWAFEGEKKFLGWFRSYLLCIISDQKTKKNTFNVYDLKNRLIAHTMVVGDVSHMISEWGNIVLIMTDRKISCVGEKDMESKLDMLFKKNLYTVAVNLIQSQQADPAATAEVLRKYGDHLYSKQEFDEAMAQYIQTVGFLEPSYVIQKFLDAQRIHNLTNYLENLHEKELASKDHTTLLLNCYTKLKDVEKLNKFIKSEDRAGENKFDVETAIRVCRAAGYHEHAMYVSKKAGKHELFLKILIEDLGRFDAGLEYISSLKPAQGAITIKEYGKILVERKPDETIELLVRLCSRNSILDFVNIFVHSPLSLMIFLEKSYPDVKEEKSKIEVNNILLELYFSNNLELNQDERKRKGINLLKREWTSDMDQAMYDVDLAVILCEMNGVRDGLLFLYEKLKLYKEVVACFVQERDREGLIDCCKRLGDASQGGDPSLWVESLKYFAEVDDDDCSKEIKEVLKFIEKDDILPPIVVLQMLARNQRLTLSVVKDYIARKLEQESKLIEDDRQSIAEFQEETEAMKKEIQDLRSNARIFQISKCANCGFTLDLPAVHFMCMHSFHLHCLGDNEQECPRCAPDYRSVLETRKNLEQNAADFETFSQKVKNSKDGFSVVADYFGKGILSKASQIPSEPSGSLVDSRFFS